MNQKVAETFRKLYLDKRTGALMSESEAVKRGVFFSSGFVVRASSSRTEDRLGEVMIRHGRISKEQFDDASHFIKSGWKLGEILVELKLIQRDEIEHFVRVQLIDIACSVLLDPPKRLFFSNLSEVEPLVSTPVSVADVIMEAARRSPDVSQRKAELISDKRRLGFATDPLLRFQDIRLNPEEAFILSRIDGSDSTSRIFAVSPLSEDDTARTLVGLLEAGVLEPEGEAPSPAESEEDLALVGDPSPGESQLASSSNPVEESTVREIQRLHDRFQKSDHWQVLGVDRSASAAEIKRAFQERAKRYHPDRYRKIVDPAVQEKIAYVFQRVSDAYQTLSTQTATNEYKKLVEQETRYEEQKKSFSAPPAPEARTVPKTGDPADAKSLYARAKRAFVERDFWSTIQFCQRAIDMVSDQPEYYHLLGMALSQNPKWLKDAEHNLRIAIKLDPWRASYLIDLGNIYKRAGMDIRAARVFEQARAVDPTIGLEEKT